MQCKLNIPKEHNLEWVASFSDDSFEKLPTKKVNLEYMFDVTGDRNGILVSYNANNESYIGAYPVQSYIDLK